MRDHPVTTLLTAGARRRPRAHGAPSARPPPTPPRRRPATAGRRPSWCRRRATTPRRSSARPATTSSSAPRGRDTIDGAGGNDVICGLDGPDDPHRGAGDDRLFGGLDGEYSIDDGYSADLITPGPGDDHVDLGADPQALDIHWVDFGYLDRVVYADAAGPVDRGPHRRHAPRARAPTRSWSPGPAGVVGQRLRRPHHRLAVRRPHPGRGRRRRGGRPRRATTTSSWTAVSARPPRCRPLDGGDDVADGGAGKDGMISSGGTDGSAGDGGKRLPRRTSPVSPGSLRGGPDKDRVYAEGPSTCRPARARTRSATQLRPGYRTEIDGDGGRDSSTSG